MGIHPTTQREKLYCIRLERIAANLNAAFGGAAGVQIQLLKELRLELMGQLVDTPLTTHEETLLQRARDGLRMTKYHAQRMGHDQTGAKDWAKVTAE